MSNLGRKLTLLRTRFSISAYRDQMGVSHSAYVVLEAYPVEIIETRQVKGMWGGGEYEGWKAVTKDGKVFTCNWESFPDDSITPTFYWNGIKDENGLWQPEDAEQALAYGAAPYVDVFGNKFEFTKITE